MKKYYDETNWEYIIRVVERPILITCILILTFIWIGMKIHLRELEEFEKTHFINIEITEEQRMSVKQRHMKDIMEMPLPENKKADVVLQEIPEIIPEEACETTHHETYEVECKSNYEESDVELLAKLMYAEEGIFIYKLSEKEAKYVCQLAGSVVLHRKNMNYGGADTIEEVIYAEGQYQCVANGSINQEVPDIVYEWAEELLQNGPIGPENMVYQAEFEQGSEVYDHVGNQYFCVM